MADELDGCLFTDAGDAGNVVAFVTHEPQNIDDLIDPLDLPLFQNGSDVKLLKRSATVPWFVNRDFISHQLVIVFVGSNHENVEVFCGCLNCERANDVVGLEAGRPDDRYVECLHQLVNHRNLRGDILWQFVPLSFVVVKDFVSKRGVACVERDRDMGRFLFFDQIEHGVRNSKNG